jgi:hypothetical protein
MDRATAGHAAQAIGSRCLAHEPAVPEPAPSGLCRGNRQAAKPFQIGGLTSHDPLPQAMSPNRLERHLGHRSDRGKVRQRVAVAYAFGGSGTPITPLLACRTHAYCRPQGKSSAELHDYTDYIITPICSNARIARRTNDEAISNGLHPFPILNKFSSAGIEPSSRWSQFADNSPDNGVMSVIGVKA